MKLIAFLVRDGVKEWNEWHGAHQQAAQHCCPYRNECDMQKKTIT